MQKFSWLGVALASLIACRTAETPDQATARMDQETASARRAIDVAQRNYERFLAEGKADSLAALYAESGRTLQPNGPTMAGRTAIRDQTAQNLAVFDQKLVITSERLLANGPMAVELGTFTANLTPKPGAPRGTAAIADKGKYMAYWRQVNGQWLIGDLIWNSDLQLPPPPAPRR